MFFAVLQQQPLQPQLQHNQQLLLQNQQSQPKQPPLQPHQQQLQPPNPPPPNLQPQPPLQPQQAVGDTPVLCTVHHGEVLIETIGDETETELEVETDILHQSHLVVTTGVSGLRVLVWTVSVVVVVGRLDINYVEKYRKYVTPVNHILYFQ